MKNRILQTDLFISTGCFTVFLLSLLILTSCATIPREQRLNNAVIVHTIEGDAADSLAGQYYQNPSEQWRILEFNETAAITPDQNIVIPLKPFRMGGVTAGGYQTVPVLAYHQFSSGKSAPARTQTRSAFESQLEYLVDHNYSVISLDRFLAFLRLEEQLPEKSILLIFDSTDQSIYDIGFPLLQRYRYPAVVFVTPTVVGQKNTLSWDQINRMAEYGIEIQCRIPDSAYHFSSKETFYRYFQNLKNAVEQASGLINTKTGRQCRLFLYPPGDHRSLLVHLLQKQGFQGAVIDQKGGNPFFVDPYALHVTRVTGNPDGKNFETLLQVFQRFD